MVQHRYRKSIPSHQGSLLVHLLEPSVHLGIDLRDITAELLAPGVQLRQTHGLEVHGRNQLVHPFHPRRYLFSKMSFLMG